VGGAPRIKKKTKKKKEITNIFINFKKLGGAPVTHC
jgi:hypothetical protein